MTMRMHGGDRAKWCGGDRPLRRDRIVPADECYMRIRKALSSYDHHQDGYWLPDGQARLGILWIMTGLCDINRGHLNAAAPNYRRYGES